jgi:hypothetical protein
MLTLKVYSLNDIDYMIELLRNEEVVWSWKVHFGFLDEDVTKVILNSRFLTQIPE